MNQLEDENKEENSVHLNLANIEKTIPKQNSEKSGEGMKHKRIKTQNKIEVASKK